MYWKIKLQVIEFFAKIGAASYSVFVWHQILLAFYRYSITSKFTVSSYIILFVGTALMSWLSYRFIEQGIAKSINTKRSKTVVYTLVALVFVAVNAFAGILYMRAGVVRDVPELYINKNNTHRGMHAEYVDRGYSHNKPFTTDKKHWYVIGNSFGRDFVNVILESQVADSVEISYSTDKEFNNELERFRKADRIFISTRGLNEDLVTKVEILSLVNGLTTDRVIVVGEKNFGESNGQIYAKRGNADYYDQYIEVEDVERYIIKNRYFADVYGSRFIDMMSVVTNESNKVRAFTPDHHFMSADCRHLSKGGAKYYAEKICWEQYLN